MKNQAFIGTYTRKEAHVDGKALGILKIMINGDGIPEEKKMVTEIDNPSFLCISPDRKYLYAVSELYKKEANSGYVYAFRINEDKSLSEISKLSTKGAAPCHVVTDKTGEFIFVSNFIGGIVMLYRRKEDGILEEQQQVQPGNAASSHTHSVILSNDNQHLYVADLGNDKIWIYDLNADKGELVQHEQITVSLDKGSGPRHMSFSLDGKFLWSVNENSNSISTFKVSENGGLELQETTSSLPDGYRGESAAADIHLHPTGDFLYVSNRGHNSIACYRVDKNTGSLKNMGYTPSLGQTPRNFAISNGGDLLYVANQDSGNIVVFDLDPVNGALNSRAEPVEAETPVCITFLNEEALPEQMS